MMNASEIKIAANGNVENEMDLLEYQVSIGTKEIEVYTRLTEIYRRQNKWDFAFSTLTSGVAMMKQVLEEEKHLIKA